MTYSIACDFSGLPMMNAVRRDSDGALVPIDADTADSLIYRNWLSAGNSPTPLPKPTLDELKTKKRAALANRRWQAETAGTIVNGLSFQTDEKTQAKLTSAVVAGVLDNAYSVNWKLSDGSFILLDHAALIAAAQGVRVHVQSCFDHEQTLVSTIVAASDETTLAAIDIEADWPI